MSIKGPLTLLFSVDLEDNRQQAPDPEVTPDRVVPATEKLIQLLDERGVRTTFFTVGDCARAHPELVRRLAERGHEIACHGDAHVQLDRHTPQSFRDSVTRNIDALMATGAPRPCGFRAPQFSLTEKTQWAWEVLESLGFRYSSSVLPAPNPLYGWPGFGARPRRVGQTLWELPVSCGPAPLRVPFASGMYMRLLPEPLFRWLYRMAATEALVCYLHPYDADPEQKRFAMMPEWHWNTLLFMRRSRTLPRLSWMLDQGCRVLPYAKYIEAL